MYNELAVKIGMQNYKVFLKDGFFQPAVASHYLHKHNYTEIHIIVGGNASYNIDDRLITVNNGGMLIIPRDIFHCCTNKENDTMITAFQINRDIGEVSFYDVGSKIILEFLEEIKRSTINRDYTKISAYISLFCSYFCSDSNLSVQPVTDYAFLIYEFFSANYAKDLHLEDLAEMLHLSERQTERLVIEYTGKTFKDELVTIRMNIAKKLLKSTDMSLSEIAQYVGYRSYAGFWKAMKKHRIEPMKDVPG